MTDGTRLTIHVGHFAPGSSKWNKIEHRVFRHNTTNWRGTPPTSYETIVDRIGNTRTGAGLRVQARLDPDQCPAGVVGTEEQMDENRPCSQMRLIWESQYKPHLAEVGKAISITVLSERKRRVSSATVDWLVGRWATAIAVAAETAEGAVGPDGKE